MYFNIYWNETAKITGVHQKISDNKPVLLALYNSGSAQKRQIKIYVPKKDLKIVGANNSTISGSVVCTDGSDNCELFFQVDLPESGNAYVKISAEGSSPSARVSELRNLDDSSKEFKLTNSASIKVSKDNNRLELNLNGNTQSFEIKYNYYEGYQDGGQKSGAYIFRPADASAPSKKYSNIGTIKYA